MNLIGHRVKLKSKIKYICENDSIDISDTSLTNTNEMSLLITSEYSSNINSRYY
jgi:hypothetical protein